MVWDAVAGDRTQAQAHAHDMRSCESELASVVHVDALWCGTCLSIELPAVALACYLHDSSTLRVLATATGMQASLQSPRPLPCLPDTCALVLPSPYRRPFVRRAGHRAARKQRAAQADSRDSYVLVDPVPPFAHDDAPAGGKGTLLGCAPLHAPGDGRVSIICH